MGFHDIDHALSASRPRSEDTYPMVFAHLSERVDDTRLANLNRNRRSWRRMRIVLPTIALVLAATTAGAVAISWGDAPDAVIPITYTTDSGKVVDCTWAMTEGVGEGERDATELKKFVQSQDWSGIGPEIYREAKGNPYLPTAGERGEFTQMQLDRFSFGLAVNTILSERISSGIGSSSTTGLGTTDCLGELE